MRRLVGAFAGRTYHIVGNIMMWLKCIPYSKLKKGMQNLKSLLIYRHWTERMVITQSNREQNATVWVYRLLCAFVVQKWQKKTFERRGSNKKPYDFCLVW